MDVIAEALKLDMANLSIKRKGGKAHGTAECDHLNHAILNLKLELLSFMKINQIK